MLKKILLSVGVLSFTTLVPTATYAASATEDISAVCASNPNSSLCVGYKKGQNSDNPVVKTLTIVINILSFLAGVLAVFLVVYGGFKYIVSAGDAGKVTSAKNTILYALVGIVVVVISRQLILFILSKVT